MIAAAPAVARGAAEPSVLAVLSADRAAVLPVAGGRPFRPLGVRGDAVRIGDVALQSVLDAQRVERVELLGSVSRSRTGSRFLRFTGSAPGFDAHAAARALRATGQFRSVVVDFPLVLSVTTPNDSFYADQWQLSAGAVETPHLPEAWDLAQGDTSVVIGIIDSGVDIGHPDLASQIFRNWGEIPGNGIDDDGNGFIDDVHGWDFGNEDNDPNPEAAIDSVSDFDFAIHGTHVAGIAAARTDNLEGISSAGWRCRLLPLKIMDSAGHLTGEKAAEAILYAADMGTEVINMSFAAVPDTLGEIGAFFQELMNEAVSADVVPVAAAGNEGMDDLRFPAACDSVLSVASTNQYNTISWFTNYGYWVNINAPGEDIYSCLVRNYDLNDTTLLYLLYIYGYDGIHPYCLQDGTSMACPLVAGVAGLVRARFPWLSAVQVIDHVIATGDDEPYDFPIGRKLNAYQAVLSAPVGAPIGPAASVSFGAMPTPFRGSTTLRFSLPRAGDVTLAVYDAGGRQVRQWQRGWLDAGPQTMVWDGRDDAGRAAPAGVYFGLVRGPDVSERSRLVLLR
jgi:subtilisin family serine protease